MLDFITKGIVKLFGTKSERDLKGLFPYVEQINTVFAQLKPLSNDALRGKTKSLKQYIQDQLKDIDDQIKSLQQQSERNPDLEIDQKEALFSQVDKLKEAYKERLEKVLTSSLPEAFAIVKETARRFKENNELVVTADDYDQVLARQTDYVKIEREQAIWYNQWEAAGNKITWDMVHYDVQLVGGVILHQGKIAEMATGEGKTLVATLPAFLNALGGKGVHIITVNDYLARRDAAWMGPIYQFHGLTVDCLDTHTPHSLARKKAYLADITYGTNNEFGFDYLRDNMAATPHELVQREHHFAMVDEVDSVLIDDARTPLIISGPVAQGGEHGYYEFKPKIQKIYEAQKKLITQLLQEAKKKLSKGNDKEGGLSLFRAYRGLPKHKPLIKYLSERGVKQILQKVENYYLEDNARMMPVADEPLLFTIDEKSNTIELTDKGIEYITNEGEDIHFFVLPDIGVEVAQIENNQQLSDQEKLQQKDDLIRDYTIKAQRIHIVNQLLKAYTLFEKDVEYIIADEKIKIVDEQTGRILEGRRYSDGLHQAIEAKENVKVEEATQTYATITLQNYFRMYAKLAGMTGTAETEASEFWEIYKLDVVVAPTHQPLVRADKEDKVYRTTREKFNAIIEEIVTLTTQKQPVLVGTTSVEISELVSKMLHLKKIKHQVLNAKHHQKEAEIIVEAGKAGTVTIATNMAGRGTDIKLTPASITAGGLAIIGTERHESRRIDRQLRGRAGRQGDVGSSQFFVSLEDNLMRLFGSDRIARIMDRVGLQEGEVIQHSMITKSIEKAQKKVEEDNFATRKRLLEYDDVMSSQRELIYTRRRNALLGERLQLDIMNMFYDTVASMTMNAKAVTDYEGFRLEILGTLGVESSITSKEFEQTETKVLIDKVYHEVRTFYQRKNQLVKAHAWPIIQHIHQERGTSVNDLLIPFFDAKRKIEVAVNLQQCIASEGEELIRAMEKAVTLTFIDQYWKEHLRELDDLRQSVQNAVYEQKDPLLVYKFEAFELFKQFIYQVNQENSAYLLKAYLAVQQPGEVQEAHTWKGQQNVHESKKIAHSLLSGEQQDENQTMQPTRSQKIAKRNERVTVQYTNGVVKRNVKFKTIEEDITNNKCILIKEI